jgi:basic amino acid/polyamine antiporter, APA family
MSGTTSDRWAPRTRDDSLAQLSPRDQQKARTIGLTSATGLVIGSIIGTGVVAMPAVMAGAGTSSLFVLAVIAVGATLLAILFGQLTRRVPNSARHWWSC